MFKGHIDRVSEDAISGWVYCELAPLAGRQALAFDGHHCIGAGEIGLHRPDLELAGLGDGRCGFVIECDQSVIRAARHINVRLEGSDFVLLPNASLTRPASRGVTMGLYTVDEERRVEWMARQGWLTQEQFLALSSLNATGAYLRTFSSAELSASPIERRVGDLYVELMSLLFRTEFSATELHERTHSFVAGQAGPLEPLARELEVVCLYGSAFSAVVHEGAHAGGTDTAEPAGGGTTYRCAPHQLLLIHSRCLQSIAAPKGTHLQVLSLLEAAP